LPTALAAGRINKQIVAPSVQYRKEDGDNLRIKLRTAAAP
jgi:hypothetical protein